jgi:DUF4097 and DUF4098 domain-containing protein YvlB
MNVSRTTTLALAIGLVIGAPHPAAAGEGWEALKSLMADVFLGAEKQQEFHWNGAVEAGATLEIKGINGAIETSPGTDEVRIFALKTGRRQDPADVEIAVVEHAGGLTVCAVYPSPDSGTPNVCAAGDAGHMSVHNNDVAVRFEIEVPAGVHVEARTVNGSVRAHGHTGDVRAHTVNGSVKIATTGRAAAETVNGSIHAVLGNSDWDEAAFSTVNGSVTLEVPDGLSTDLDVQTVNGSIRSDFDLARTQSKTKRSLRGTIGDGGRTLEIETVNGSVKLLRADTQT